MKSLLLPAATPEGAAAAAAPSEARAKPAIYTVIVSALFISACSIFVSFFISVQGSKEDQ